MKTFNFPGVGPIRTFDKPPESDPLGRWPDSWGDGYQVITPDFRVNKPVRKRSSKNVNLSGYFVFRETQETTINSVEATWTVPNCYPPKEPLEGNWYTTSSWIGIDGDGRSGDKSKDILQVGVDSDVMQFGGTITRWVSAWYQWVPAPTVWIPNFHVSQGDTLNGIIAMKKGSKTTATIYLHNRTSGKAASFHVTAHKGTKLRGNCAEWIVEKVELDGDPPSLASYGAVCFDEAKAFTDDGREIELEPLGKFYEMTSDDKEVISRAHFRGQKLVRCVYEGPTTTDILSAEVIKTMPKNSVFSRKDAKELKAREDELKTQIASGEDSLGKLKETMKSARKVRVRHYGAHCGW